MTEREYRQDDTTEGYCARCGQGLSNVTVAGTGYCEIHGWVYADWHMAREIAEALPSDRDPGDEIDEREAQP